MLKVNEIIPDKLYQRANFYKYSKAQKLEFLEHYGIDIVVALWGDGDSEIEHELWDYVYWPVPDSKVKIPEGIPELAKELAQDIREGYTVLSHCHAGRNRAGLLNALIIYELYGWCGQKIVDYMEERRPNNMTSNQYFLNYVKSLPKKE